MKQSGSVPGSWIASWSLSSGRPLRADPLARNDEEAQPLVMQS